MTQVVKYQPAMQETQVQSLDWEGALEKEMATHCSILPWRIPWAEEPGRLQSMGSQRVRNNLATKPTYLWCFKCAFLRRCVCLQHLESDNVRVANTIAYIEREQN